MLPVIQQSEFLIDGIALFHTNWNFFTPLANVYIPLPFVLQSSEINKSIKGTRVLRNLRYMWTLKLFHINSFEMKLIVCSNLKTIPYVEIIAKLRVAIENCISRLKSTTHTKRFHDQTLPDNIRYLCVMQCDYKEFGYLLEQEISGITQQTFYSPFTTTDEGRLEMYFFASAFGQNAVVHDILPNINVDWVNLSEIIVHVATDYVLKDHVLLWDRQKIQDLFMCEPNYEYCNAGVIGCGNFYFIPKVMNNDVCFTLVKLYSELTKYVKTTKAFKTSEIASFLCESEGSDSTMSKLKQRRMLQTIKKYIDQCNGVMRCVKSLKTYTFVSARLECLVSVLGGTNHWEQVLDYCKRFRDLNNFNNVKLFKSLPVLCLQKRIESYVGCSISTILSQLNQLRYCLTEGDKIFGFSIEDYCNVAASEIICCFMLYGSAVSTFGTRGHNNRLISYLGLNVRRFKEGTPINPRLCNAVVKFCSGFVKYIGPMPPEILETSVSSKFMSNNLLQPKLFSETLEQLENSRLEVIYKLFWATVVQSTLKVFKSPGKTVDATYRHACFYQLKQVVTVDEFITFLQHAAEAALVGHGTVISLRQIVLRKFNCKTKVEYFYKGLIIYVNKLCGTWRSPFMFGLPRFKKNLIVTPVYGPENEQLTVRLLSEAFNIRFLGHKIKPKDLYSSISSLWNTFRYIPNYVWTDFKKTDMVLNEVFQCCNNNTKIMENGILKYF